MTTFLGLPLLTFLPVFARDIFHGDVGTYSQMMAFSGAGAVVGALVVAWLGRFRHMGLTLLLVQVVFGALIVAFALSRVFWLSNLLLFAAGACLMCVFSMTASLVQLIVPDHLRGRVMSIYMVAFRGGMPLGSLASGYAASLTSAPYVLARQRRARLTRRDLLPGPEPRGEEACRVDRRDWAKSFTGSGGQASGRTSSNLARGPRTERLYQSSKLLPVSSCLRPPVRFTPDLQALSAAPITQNTPSAIDAAGHHERRRRARAAGRRGRT